MKTVFIHITKIHSITLTAKISLCSRRHKLFPVASEGDSFTWLQNQRTGAGGVGGGGWQRTEGEEKRYTQRKKRKVREWEREGRGWGGENNETRQENPENGASHRENVCKMCLRGIMRKTWDRTTMPLCP